MHFRRRGNHIQIVKTQPQAGTGRAVSRPVGSINLQTGQVRAKEGTGLTEAEIVEAQAYVARQRALEAQRSELEYRMLGQTLGEVAGWIATADAALVAEHAEEVRAGLQQLRRALDRAVGAPPRAKPAG